MSISSKIHILNRLGVATSDTRPPKSRGLIGQATISSRYELNNKTSASTLSLSWAAHPSMAAILGIVGTMDLYFTRESGRH